MLQLSIVQIHKLKETVYFKAMETNLPQQQCSLIGKGNTSNYLITDVKLEIVLLCVLLIT